MDEDILKGRLRRATKAYWQKLGEEYREDLLGAITEYSGVRVRELDGRSLLKAEMDWAETHGGMPQKPQAPRPAATLVLLVGFSLEPLLQAIYAYKPGNILLVLSSNYADENGLVFGGRVKQAIGLLAEYGLLEATPAIQLLQIEEEDGKGEAASRSPADSTTEDAGANSDTGTAAAVFRALVGALHATREVILDITGGKKSMVSGAFLYATYANAAISYVDFVDYDRTLRRPYGYTCQIRQLANPQRQFGLRDWERVRTLYQAYRFQEAATLLQGDIQRVFDDDLKAGYAALAAMQTVIACYAAWENGDYHLAHRQVAAIQRHIPGFVAPAAVTILGPDWFHTDAAGKRCDTPKFYGDARLPVYIRDELARIRRVIDHSRDYRAAFLRAGGLNEVIMLARLVQLATLPADKDTLLQALEGDTPRARTLFHILAGRSAGSDIHVRRELGFKNAPALALIVNEAMTHWWEGEGMFGAVNGWEDFIEFRNDLTHKYAPATKQWADAAHRFVAANANDFLREWDETQPQPGAGEQTQQATQKATQGEQVGHKGQESNALTWEQLCSDTGMVQWLPAGLVKGEEGRS